MSWRRRNLPYSRETIERARAVNLAEYLKCRGVELIPKGKKYYCLKEHDSLIINRVTNEWYWNSQSQKGCNAIDFLMYYYKQSFLQAVEDLIDGNLFTEMPSAAELAQQLERKKELLQRRKADGEIIPGRLLDIIAKELGINAEAARRMDTINRRAIEPVKEQFQSGNLSLREAFKTSQRAPEEQKALIDQKLSGKVSHLFPEKKVVHVPPEDTNVRSGTRTTREAVAEVVHVPPGEKASRVVDFTTLSPITDAVHSLKMAVTANGRRFKSDDDARRAAETIQRVAEEIKALQADIWIHSK